MKPEHSIEEHFRSEFSEWNPAVPSSVKTELDKAILAPKRKRFFWLWMLIPFFSLGIGTVAYFYSTNSTKDSPNQAKNSGVSELNSTQNDESLVNNSESSSQQNNNTLDANSIANKDNSIATTQDIFNSPNVKPASSKTKPQNSLNQVQYGNGRPSVGNSASSFANDKPQNTTSGGNSNQNPELPPVRDINSQDLATRDSSSAGNASTNSVQLNTQNEPDVQVPSTSSQNPPQPPSYQSAVDSTKNSSVAGENPSPQSEVPSSNSPFSKFFVGGLFSVMQGKNSFSNPETQLTEMLSYNGALELGYKFNKSFALVSGFNYQTRREDFQTQSYQVDSNFLGLEIQYIYEPNNPVPVDSITITVFSYDTTFTSSQQNGSWRYFGLPLFIDWTLYERPRISFGVQAGTVLGIASFKSFDAFNNPLEQWSKFSNQLLVRPYFYYHVGPWRFGLHLSMQYDLVMPQSWALLNHKRYSYGLGFSIRYQLPAR
jgi:hypothetical protein